ncbi:MAG: hypothetical protein IPJ40_03085 [Saprospirales bacterium]|nr:hypothetical protein [Saprospirales bacterium]
MLSTSVPIFSPRFLFEYVLKQASHGVDVVVPAHPAKGFILQQEWAAFWAGSGNG